VNVSYHIPHSFKRQDPTVTRTTFYGVVGLKSLANHRPRLYHTHKVWCRGADEGLIEYDKVHEWFTDYFDSKLVMVCKGRHLRDTMREGSRLNPLSFCLFVYITDKLCFYFLISF